MCAVRSQNQAVLQASPRRAGAGTGVRLQNCRVAGVVNPNVLKAVGEVLGARNVTPASEEPMGDAVARALHVSDAQAERWLEALSQGCTADEANARAGIVPTPDNESILTAVARALGSMIGNLNR